MEKLSTHKKLWAILNSNQRRGSVVLFGMMFVGMLLETLGVGLFVPILAVLTQIDAPTQHPVLTSLINGMGNPTREQLVIISMLLLVGVYAIKTLFISFLVWRQSQFVYGVRAEISHRLFSVYLRQPFTFHLGHNSAQLIHNITNDVETFIGNGLISGLLLMTEISIIVGVLFLLLTIEPLGALLVMSMFGFASWGMNHMARPRLTYWGKARQRHESLRLQHLQQGLGGIKDVKLMGKEEGFISKFNPHNIGSAQAEQRKFAMAQLSRLALEQIAITGLAMLVVVMVSQGKPLGTVVPTLGLFAAAAFRLIPSVNRILSALQSLRYVLPAIEVLYRQFNLPNDASKPACDPKPLSFHRELTLSSVSFHYPETETASLSNINLSIFCGSSVGFVGYSGSGKSTLIDVILGLLTPTSGTVLVDGQDIQTNIRGWQDQIGYVPQSIYLTDDTLRNNIAFGQPVEYINESDIWRALSAAQLEKFVKSLPQGLDTLVGERGVRLSGGQRQRIGIARALYCDPPILVLDEATSSLDTETEHEFMESVRALQGEKTILIVSHRLTTIEHCDFIFSIEKGRISNEESGGK